MTTTTSAVAEGPASPWDLPLEQRPPLFDPCEEIPVEAVEEALGGPVTPTAELANRRPGELISCGWKSDEVLFGALSTWKSRNEYLTDDGYILLDNASNISGRVGMQLGDPGDSTRNGCTQLFFTSNGTVMFSVDLISGLSSFRGEMFTQACDVLDQVASPLVPLIPGGDYT